MGNRQEEGFLGALVGRLIRRTLRQRFRTVYWNGPVELPAKCIFAANHHGWHDGYLMFAVVSAVNRRSLDWIQEFDAFPLFQHAGGMPFPADDPVRRAATIRKTIRLMNEEDRSLILFAEPHLHRGPEVLPLGQSLEFIARHTGASVIPVAIRYDMSIHERPEAYISLQPPIEGDLVRDRTRSALISALRQMDLNADTWRVLVRGTKDVNERWDMRRIPQRRGFPSEGDSEVRRTPN